MLARKLMVLACFLCGGNALATEFDEPMSGTAPEISVGIVADTVMPAAEIATGSDTLASGTEESRPGSEENKDG